MKLYLCGPRKHNCQPFCGPEAWSDCRDSVMYQLCTLRPAPLSCLCLQVRILGVLDKTWLQPPPAVVLLFDRLRRLCPVLWPLHSITIWCCKTRISRATRDHSRFQWPRPSHSRLLRRPRLATSTTNIVLELKFWFSHWDWERKCSVFSQLWCCFSFSKQGHSISRFSHLELKMSKDEELGCHTWR